MEIFELISMFFPVLMIALFIFISVRKAIKNKKADVNPAGKRHVKKPKHEKQPAPSQVHSELRPWLERFPDMARKISGPNDEQIEKEPPTPQMVKTVQPASAESLNVLDAPENYALESYGPTVSDSTSMRNENRQRLSRLPELKKAVIWAEILEKPKGLE